MAVEICGFSGVWVPSYDGDYLITNGGLSVISFKSKPRELRWVKSSNGYLHCTLSHPGRKMLTYSQHRSVYEFHCGKVDCGMQIDHINGCKSDNRIENLRLVTGAENMLNRGVNRNNSSGEPNVSWNSVRCRWEVKVITRGVTKHGGYFNDKSEAILAARSVRIGARGSLSRDMTA